MKLNQYLIKTHDPQRAAYFWNALGACLNSFQTMLLLLVITHFGSNEDSSAFVMAFAIGNLMLHVGKFGVRQFQVTDITDLYSFSEYKSARFVSLLLMLTCSAAYITWGFAYRDYTPIKGIIISLIIIYKAVEAFEDVLHGRLQQLGRLDVAAKIFTIRLGVFIVAYATLFTITRNIVLTTVFNVLFSCFLSFILNYSVRSLYQESSDANNCNVRALLTDCLPLCITAVAMIYLGNAPKYIVDGLVSDEVQTAFNIVFMPAFVVALLSNFIFNPVLKKMGLLWHDNNVTGLRKFALKLLFVPICLDLFVLLIGYYYGIPALSTFYGVDLSAYKSELLVFLLASGVIALQNLFTALLTTMRLQKHLLLCFCCASILVAITGRLSLTQFGLTALCWSYLIVLLLVVLYIGMVFLRKTHESSNSL